MKKWQIIAPIGFAAAGVAAALILGKKPAGSDSAKPANTKAPSKAVIKNAKTGSYSFVSGYKDAATVELSVVYDADRFSFSVIEDGFLSYSSDSHVAVICGEDFSMQIEYATYYQGEGFDALTKNVQEKFKGFGTVEYGCVKGIKYIDGDNVCMCFPISGDDNSYVLVTLVKAKDNDDDFTVLPDYPDVAAIIESFSFSVVK